MSQLHPQTQQAPQAKSFRSSYRTIKASNLGSGARDRRAVRMLRFHNLFVGIRIGKQS
jgi:hypothetical protein